MNQKERAMHFQSLHVPGEPLTLYNVWDAGTAQAVAKAGAKAIATGSASVAMAQGYDDGEATPLDVVEQIISRICASVSLPVTLDFEGGYSETPAGVAENVARMIDAGAIGINFEDQVVHGEGLYAISAQAQRIGAIREMAEKNGVPIYINARTDLFLQGAPETHAGLMAEATTRASAYAAAGASGFFAPGLVNKVLIGELCRGVNLPVNIMMQDGAPTVAELAQLGVARISYGPGPYFAAMRSVTESAAAIT